MSPYAEREHAIIQDASLSFEAKVEALTDHVVTAVKESPRKDVPLLLHCLILLEFSLCMMRLHGYKFTDEEMGKIKTAITPFIIEKLKGNR